MTPAELNRGIEALSIKLKQLEHGERIAYWHLMDLLDQGSPELSRALDGELHRLEATGELVFVEDDEGAESMVERRVPVKRKKKPAAKKKPKPGPKKKAVAKKQR